MEKISWVDKISDEEVLQRINETKTMLDIVRKCKYVARACAETCIIIARIEGRMKGKATRGRKRMHLLSDLMKGNYVALKRIVEDRKE